VGTFIRKRPAGVLPMLRRRLVYNNHVRLTFPQLALFAARPIPAGTELFI